ncbi:sulfur oxidation c-type cytochrome SoxX [Thalassobius vesicularis]|uniref:Sulfur oxidation c-type cytochrome SoxX n=1 Tax=Thalassobius vesicularis TaxID=1294297 RepID=A0A4V3UZ77_9RHOB|nr:sulfur oxidation c-type cytochrome SoxX [Thalassobius vesicularis]THD75609.1 sulfur oxidation c-type cytochrome SoxX [Thalassobius vesicularis]
MRLTTLTLAASLAAGAAFANPVAPADVVFTDDGAVEASLTGAPGNPEQGFKVFSDKKQGNCVACHNIEARTDLSFPGNVGPMLDGVGENRSVAELRGILTNSKNTFEGTVMPAYYKVDGFTRPGDDYTGKAPSGPLSPLLSAEQIEDVVAFLSTLK